MIDVGLAAGVKELWKDGMLHDFILKVEGHEFHVHKVVHASVSNYLKAMFGGGFIESRMDEVELIGLSSDAVSKILEFIYSGERNAINGDIIEILRCAIYLQMPFVAEFCVRKLLEDLNHKNSLTVLYVCQEFSYHRYVEEVKIFIKLNWKMIFENCTPKDMSSNAVQVLIDYWKSSDWEMFLFIRDWVYGEFETRKDFVPEFMTQVRFSVIRPKEVEAITKMDIFNRTEGSWKGLVQRALEYHQLPMNVKVLDKSEQTQLRTDAAPVLFASETSEDPDTFFRLNERNQWIKHEREAFNTPACYVNCYVCCIEINNFLVICTRDDENQEWYIFDPRMLTWFKLARMPRPLSGFALVHHKDHLYTVGGCHFPEIPAAAMERYSFLTNTWQVDKELPVPISLPAACVLEDTMYVNGGWINRQQTNRLYCLDLSSPSAEWESKAPALWKCGAHSMFVVTVHGEEVVLNIYLPYFRLQYYSPSRDQWFSISENIIPWDFDSIWVDDSIVIPKGNSFFILNVRVPRYIDEGEDDESIEWKHVCWHWKLVDNTAQVMEVAMEDFPLPSDDCGDIIQSMFSAALSLPPEICQGAI